VKFGFILICLEIKMFAGTFKPTQNRFVPILFTFILKKMGSLVLKGLPNLAEKEGFVLCQNVQ